MLWNNLDLGWQKAFEMAWEGYINNAIPIGAAVLNEEGNIVSAGRNMIISNTGTPPQIYNHKLAHAEINAILSLNESEHPKIRKYTLYTTMEPCPLCFGAIVMGHIRHFKYAARDRVAGAAQLNDCLDYLKSKNTKIEGPFEILEQVQIAQQTCFHLEDNPKNCERIFVKWRETCEIGVDLGYELFSDQTLQKFKDKGAPMCEVFEYIANAQL